VASVRRDRGGAGPFFFEILRWPVQAVEVAEREHRVSPRGKRIVGKVNDCPEFPITTAITDSIGQSSTTPSAAARARSVVWGDRARCGVSTRGRAQTRDDRERSSG